MSWQRVLVGVVASVALVVSSVVSGGQEQGQARSIQSGDFARLRPGSGQSARLRYKYQGRVAAPVGSREDGEPVSGAVEEPEVNQSERALVGVTLWRLREVESPRAGALRVRGADGGESWAVAERWSPLAGLRVNDMVRLTVESGGRGYLYVVNCEVYQGGRLGRAEVLFPAGKGVNNLVSAGEVVGIPDRADKWPYFRIRSQAKGYWGELVVVVVVREPVKSETEGDLTKTLMGYVGRGARGAVYELEAGAWRDETPEEMAVEGGNQSRSMSVGAGSVRRLERDGPLPALLYEVKVGKGGAVVVPLWLRVQGAA